MSSAGSHILSRFSPSRLQRFDNGHEIVLRSPGVSLTKYQELNSNTVHDNDKRDDKHDDKREDKRSRKPGKEPKQFTESMRRKFSRLLHCADFSLEDITTCVKAADGPSRVPFRNALESDNDGQGLDDCRLKSSEGRERRHATLASEADTSQHTSGADRLRNLDRHELCVDPSVSGSSPADRGRSAHLSTASDAQGADKHSGHAEQNRWSVDLTKFASGLEAVSNYSRKTIDHLLHHLSIDNVCAESNSLTQPIIDGPLDKLSASLGIDTHLESGLRPSQADDHLAQALYARIQQHAHDDDAAKAALSAYIRWSEKRTPDRPGYNTHLTRGLQLYDGAVSTVLAAEQRLVQTQLWHDGVTPLHLAASLGYSRLCGVLLWAGGDPQAQMRPTAQQDARVSVSMCCEQALFDLKTRDPGDTKSYHRIIKCRGHLMYGFDGKGNPVHWQKQARFFASRKKNEFRKLCDALDRDANRIKQRRSVHDCGDSQCPFTELNTASAPHPGTGKRPIHFDAADGVRHVHVAAAPDKRQRQPSTRTNGASVTADETERSSTFLHDTCDAQGYTQATTAMPMSQIPSTTHTRLHESEETFPVQGTSYMKNDEASSLSASSTGASGSSTVLNSDCLMTDDKVTAILAHEQDIRYTAIPAPESEIIDSQSLAEPLAIRNWYQQQATLEALDGTLSGSSPSGPLGQRHNHSITQVHRHQSFTKTVTHRPVFSLDSEKAPALSPSGSKTDDSPWSPHSPDLTSQVFTTVTRVPSASQLVTQAPHDAYAQTNLRLDSLEQIEPLAFKKQLEAEHDYMLATIKEFSADPAPTFPGSPAMIVSANSRKRHGRYGADAFSGMQASDGSTTSVRERARDIEHLIAQSEASILRGSPLAPRPVSHRPPGSTFEGYSEHTT
ncbi:hypothetical protein LTR95_012815 [Oleoguttula sp. CCFEE 5521]